MKVKISSLASVILASMGATSLIAATQVNSKVVDNQHRVANNTGITDENANSNHTTSCITREEILGAQETWGNAIVKIGEAYTEGEDYKAVAAKTVDKLYGYDEGAVLFKPTKASKEQFRLSEEEAISYFVTGAVAEDHGFAIQPWSQVKFEDAGMIINCDSAMAMGNYYFTDANTGEEAKAEFTFGYRKDKDGKLLIDLHHSSFPYTSDS